MADVSLLNGAFPTLLGMATLVTLGVAAMRPDRRWMLVRLPAIVLAALLIVVVVNWRLDLRTEFDDDIPIRFLIWVTMPVAAVGIAVFGWRGERRWRRVASILAVPLCAMYAANLINQFYGYEPTFGALFHSDVDDQVDPSSLGLGGALPTTSAAPGGARASGPTWTAAAPPATEQPPPSPATTGPGGSATTAETIGRRGSVTTLTIPGTVSGFAARPAYIWVPPAFFATPRPHLPVVVMLAGVPGQPDNMIRAADATAAADSYAAAHAGRAPVIVFADANGSFTADTECVDGSRGNAETYLTVDVPRFVEAQLSTASDAASWGVAGYSEGGTCAMDLALGHPDVFGTFVDIAGDAFPNAGTHGDARAMAIADLYGGNAALFDAHDPSLLAARPADRSVAGWFEDGTHDHGKAAVGAALDATLRADGLESHLVTAPGGHDFAMCTHAVADSFAWLAQRLGT